MDIELTEDQKVKLLNTDDAYAIMQKVLLRENKIDQEKEHFWIIGLNNAHKILFIELVSLGSVTATQIEPMNVFRVAVMKGAVKVILAHNHPSGELEPSEDDKNVTDRLIQVGRILNIEVLDHLIISTESFLSFARGSLFEELSQSTRWVPAYELIERIRKEEQEIGKEAIQLARKEEAIGIAKRMKYEGIETAVISNLSGLTNEEVKKL